MNGNEGTGSGRGPDVLVYTGGTTTEELTFSLVVAAASATHNALDVLYLGANVMAQVGGSTILAVSDDEAAAITNLVAIGTAAGSILTVA